MKTPASPVIVDAARRARSGDQAPQPIVILKSVSCRRPEPSASIAHSSQPPVRVDMNDSVRPSGDQVAIRSLNGSSVSRRVSLPSLRKSTRSSWPVRAVHASHDPSDEGAHQPSEALRIVDLSVGLSGFAGSNAYIESSNDRSVAAIAIREPSREKRALASARTPLVIGSGAPLAAPLFSSMATRHRFGLPPRSLMKYSQRPSGDHSGAQSVAASRVTWTGVPPAAATVWMSRCPCVLVQNAMRSPCGDHAGCTASLVTSFFDAPEARSTDHNSDVALREYGSRTASVPKASIVPSGDQAGSNPVVVTRRTDSPVAPMT